jgi:hypothetical protein
MDAGTAVTLKWTALQALHATRRAERTRRLWANPLSINAPDPLRLAVVEFNAGLGERQRELLEQAAELQARIEILKQSEGRADPLRLAVGAGVAAAWLVWRSGARSRAPLSVA